MSKPRYQFVTGRLAEFSLRQVLDDLAPKAGFEAEIAVLPITVAALMPPKWIARHLTVSEGVEKVIIPGLCQGDLTPIVEKIGADSGVVVERGPNDLRDLPVFFGGQSERRQGYGGYDIAILAEINHAPRLSLATIVEQGERLIAQGADIIDLGCDPGDPWSGVGDAVRALTDLGITVSIDSFHPQEVAEAARAGAKLVLSVNASNREFAPDWGIEVVIIPDQVGTFEGLDESLEFLDLNKVPFRIDPILEPMGFGFAQSLGRYIETRKRYPQAEILMGVGNLTELTDVDSAGVNMLLIGFCQEVGIRSVLTTQVINWARDSVKEIDLARRLAYHSINRKIPPKHLEPGLIMLRDPKIHRHGAENLAELQRRIKDANWRIFAEDGVIHAINNNQHLVDDDPFVLFEQMNIDDPSHAFYLGYEMMKAKTALTLGKDYRQDQALSWGHLTQPEISRIDRHRHKS